MAWTFFWTITVLHWYKKLENLLYLINENVLSHRGTGEALCKRDYSPCDCGTTCKYGILLAIVGFLQIMCFRAEKKSWFFPHISYILFPFIHFKSHFEIQGNKQFKSHLLPKCNWCSGKKKKKRQQSFLQGRPHSSSSVMCCKPRLGTHRHILSCAWVYHWLWKPIYPVAVSSTA